MRIIELARRLTLLIETLNVFRIFGKSLRQNLYRHNPIQAELSGLVNNRHCACTDFP
jgi:hypothetical protein